MGVIARHIDSTQDRAPMQVLPADPKRREIYLNAGWRAGCIASTVEPLTSALGKQQSYRTDAGAFFRIRLRNYTGPLHFAAWDGDSNLKNTLDLIAITEEP